MKDPVNIEILKRIDVDKELEIAVRFLRSILIIIEPIKKNELEGMRGLDRSQYKELMETYATKLISWRSIFVKHYENRALVDTLNISSQIRMINDLSEELIKEFSKFNQKEFNEDAIKSLLQGIEHSLRELVNLIQKHVR